MSQHQDSDERNDWAAAVEERRDLALAAAVSVADTLGVGAERPAILADSNNTIVWLAPAPIVAKVGTSHFRDAELESLARELAVSAHLSGLGAAVVAPVRGLAAGPHRWRDLTLTLWQYAEPSGTVAPEPAEAAAAMSAVHDALAVFPGSLPRFELELADARRFLRPERSPTLLDSDRHFLLSVVGEVEERLGGWVTEPRALHGSPHAGNWLRTTQGLLLLDFETACRGPLEWDLAALDDAAVQLFAEVDFELVALLRRMRSVCVAAKCWVEPNRAPEVREAARVHLKLLRGEPLD
jgi:hypothetical protein